MLFSLSAAIPLEHLIDESSIHMSQGYNQPSSSRQPNASDEVICQQSRQSFPAQSNQVPITHQSPGNDNLSFYMFLNVWYGKHYLKYNFLNHWTHILLGT